MKCKINETGEAKELSFVYKDYNGNIVDSDTEVYDFLTDILIKYDFRNDLYLMDNDTFDWWEKEFENAENFYQAIRENNFELAEEIQKNSEWDSLKYIDIDDIYTIERKEAEEENKND